MKMIIYVVATLSCASAFEQGPQAVFGSDHGPQAMPGPANGSSDRVLLMGADQMPLPPPPAELQKLQATSMMKADDGFSSASHDPYHVQQFMNDLEMVKANSSTAEEANAFAERVQSGKAIPTAPVVVKNLGELKLGFTPAAVRSGKLIGAAPQGTLVNGKWTGAERYFEIEGGGYSRLSETDMAASGGMFYMNKSAVNTTVGNKPAISVVMTDDNGRRVEEVLWVSGGMLFKITYAPNQQSGRYGMMKTHTAISAVSLAGELR